VVKVCRHCGRVLKGKRWVRAKVEGGEMVTCEDCARHPETHSAILQVKGGNPENVEKLIAEELETSRAEGKVERVFEKGGKYHFTSKSMARAVARKLKRQGGELLETSKVVTYDRQKSRQKTRITLRIHFPVSRGDVVQYRSRKYLVIGMRDGFVLTKEGKKIRLKHAKRVPCRRMEGFYISSNPPLVFLEATGETIEVPEKGKGKVEVVISGKKVWTLPL